MEPLVIENPTVAPPEPLFIGEEQPSVSRQLAQRRALDYHRSLGDSSPGPDAIFNRLINGQEDQLREELASADRDAYFKRRQELLQRFMTGRPAGTPPDARELRFIQTMSTGELAEALAGDPKTYIERRLAENTLRRVESVNPQNDSSALIEDAASRLTALTAYAQKKLEEIKDQQNQRSESDLPYLGRNAMDTFSMMISPLQWYRQTNALGPGVSSSFSRGDNVAEQARWYYSQRDIRTATEALDRAVEQLSSTNLINAADYLHSIIEASDWTRFMGNIESYADVAPGIGWVPYALAGRLGYRAGRSAVRRFTGTQAATPPASAAPAPSSTPTTPPPTPPSTATYAQAAADVAHATAVNRGRPDAEAAITEASGDLASAGAMTARSQILDAAALTHDEGAFDSFTGYARSFFNPAAVLYDAGTRLSNEAAQRIRVALDKTAETLANRLFVKPVQVDRLTAEQVAVAAEESARIAVGHQYNHVADRILDTRLVSTTEWTAYPKPLRNLMKAAYDVEKYIQNYGLHKRFVDYSQAVLMRANLRTQLGNPRAIPKNVTSTLRKAMANVEEEEMKELLKQYHIIDQAIKAVSKPDRELFDKATKARLKYNEALGQYEAAMGRPMRMVRPSGFDAVDKLRNIPVQEGLGNVRYIIIPFGKSNAELFESEAQALISASKELNLREGSYRVVQHGTGYYVAVMKPIDETAASVRDAFDITDLVNKTPRPWLPWRWAQFIKGGSLKLPGSAVADLKAAVYGSSGMINEVAKIVNQTVIKPIKSGGSLSIKDFTRFIEYERTLKDPTSNIPGSFSVHQAEFENRWVDVTGRYPTEKESLAYWSYVQITNIDKMLRDLSVYRDKARAGLELHHMPLLSSSLSDPPIEGKILATLDVDAARASKAGFLVWDADPNVMQHVFINSKGGKDKIDELMGRGYKLVQITHYAQDNLEILPGLKEALGRMGSDYAKEFSKRGVTFKGNPPVDFILTKELTSSPLPFQQTPHRGGGHHQYAFEYVISQPKIRGNKYYGDNTLRGFEYGADAKYFLSRYEEARRIMNRIDDSNGRVPESELENYLAKNLPENAKDFRKLFVSGPYDRTVAFSIRRSGQNIWRSERKLQDEFPGLENGLEDGLNLYNTSTLRFMQERGETPMTVARSGTLENPSFNLQPAPMVDALPTMDRAIRHIVNNTAISDVQIKSAERFIQEFSGVLDRPIEALRADPWDALLNAGFRDGAPRTDIMAAINYRTAAMQTLGIRPVTERVYDTTSHKMLQWLYERTPGGKGVNLPVVRNPVFHKLIDNPASAARHALAHYYLSSPYQFFVQAAGALNIAAIGGMKVAGEAMFAAIYGRIIRDYTGAKGMMEHAVEKLAGNGWKREHFQEAYQAGIDTGFLTVGREHALVDALQSTPTAPIGYIGSRVGRGVKAAASVIYPMWFFRKGEEIARHMSFWAAYKLWRNANPSALLDDAAKIHILNEADRFTGNMSTVGMSELQRFGPTGVATTFWGYNMRIWEQLMGLDQSKLSFAQKSKMFGYWMMVNSLIFGVPAAAGTALFGAQAFFPYGGNVFRWLLDNRTKETDQKNQLATDMNNLEDNHAWLFNLIFKGAIHGLAPGTNITERLSPGGNRFFSEFLGEKEMWEIVVGASASPVRDTILATSPFLTMIADTFRPTDSKVGIEIGIEDIERVINALGGRQTSAIMRSYWALSTHRLMSNQRMTIDGLTRGEQIIFTLTGLVPERVETAFNITKNEKSLVELQQFHNKYIREEWRNQIRAIEEDRFEDVGRHQRNIRAHLILGHYRPDQLQRVVSDLMGDRGSTVDNIFQRFSTQSPRHARFYNEYLRMLGKQN